MIRQFHSDDAQACCDVIHACVEQDAAISPETREKLLRMESPQSIQRLADLFYLAVYESQDEIVAIGGIDMNEIRLLYVSPEHQGRGIGGKLLTHLEALVPAALFPDIFVYSTTSAEGFYRARGYRSGGECAFDLDGDSLQTVFMTKPMVRSQRSHTSG